MLLKIRSVSRWGVCRSGASIVSRCMVLYHLRLCQRHCRMAEQFPLPRAWRGQNGFPSDKGRALEAPSADTVAEGQCMPLHIMLIVLGAAALHATWNALIKAGTDTFLATVLIVTCAGAWGGVTLPFRPLPAPACWPYLLTSVAIHFAYFSCIALAYRQGDLSYAYPLMRGTAPLLTAVAGVVLVREPLSAGGMLGIALLSLGILLLAGETLWAGTLPPRATVFALANAVVISTYTLVDGFGVRRSGDAASYIAWLLVLSALGLLSFVLTTRRRALRLHFQAYWKHGLLGGLCTMLSYGLALWAMTYASVALVAALRETSVIFATLIGTVSLKEHFGMARAMAVLLVTAGATAMRLL